MQAISRRQLAAAVAGQLEKGRPLDVVVRSLAAYLIAERRVQELDSLLRDVELLRSEAGRLEVTVASRRPLAADVRAAIERFVRRDSQQSAPVIINEIIDPELIGGIRMETVDRQLDLSVRGKLDHFKQLAGK